MFSSEGLLYELFSLSVCPASARALTRVSPASDVIIQTTDRFHCDNHSQCVLLPFPLRWLLAVAYHNSVMINVSQWKVVEWGGAMTSQRDVEEFQHGGDCLRWPLIWLSWASGVHVVLKRNCGVG